MLVIMTNFNVNIKIPRILDLEKNEETEICYIFIYLHLRNKRNSSLHVIFDMKFYKSLYLIKTTNTSRRRDSKDKVLLYSYSNLVYEILL